MLLKASGVDIRGVEIWIACWPAWRSTRAASAVRASGLAGLKALPFRTKTIVVRSRIERGRSAERMPVGIASNVQKKAPPKTSDAVTGASCATTQRTDVPKRNEYPSEACRTMFQRKSQYCW